MGGGDLEKRVIEEAIEANKAEGAKDHFFHVGYWRKGNSI